MVPPSKVNFQISIILVEAIFEIRRTATNNPVIRSICLYFLLFNVVFSMDPDVYNKSEDYDRTIRPIMQPVVMYLIITFEILIYNGL